MLTEERNSSSLQSTLYNNHPPFFQTRRLFTPTQKKSVLKLKSAPVKTLETIGHSISSSTYTPPTEVGGALPLKKKNYFTCMFAKIDGVTMNKSVLNTFDLHFLFLPEKANQ